MSDDDPFAEPAGPPRDGKGRPLIIPLKRGKPDLKAKPIAYTRASTFAKAFSTDGGGNLARWKTRHAALGIALRPDLARMAAALGRNLNDFTPDQKRDLDDIIERAHDTSGGNDKANWGTAVHSLTEPGNDGVAIHDVMARDVASYRAVLAAHGLACSDSETFVVNDTLQVAGTFDDVYLLERDLTLTAGDDAVTLEAGTRLIGDKKTGSLHFDEHAIQLAVYARGQRIDFETGERSALDVSPQWGILAHIPNSQADTILYLVDLHVGWEAAKLAKAVRDFTSAKTRKSYQFPAVEVETQTPTADVDPFDVPATGEVVVVHPDGTVEVDGQVDEPDADAAALALVTETLRVDEVRTAIANAKSADECRALWSQHRRTWTDDHTAAVQARLAELGAAA